MDCTSQGQPLTEHSAIALLPIVGTLRATPAKRQRIREELQDGYGSFYVYADGDDNWCMDLHGIIIAEVTLPQLLRHVAAILEEA